ncbi:MAG: hypothetical protein IT371_09880 [Deltaproteobacteria bacterium]|nr:hypothetical protein [Deltaproteobacteria bacterium]
MSTTHYDLLSRLVAYPGPELRAEVAHAVVALSESYPRAAQKLEHFLQLLPADDLLALRELHTRTFDVQPITSLDIGYTLFGEDYKRGALLANLSSEHTRVGNDCGTELADHLTNVLRLLPKLIDASLREELVRVLLGPALEEMIREFDPTRLAKKEALYKKHHKTLIEAAAGETRVAYRHLLEAIFEVLRQDFSLKTTLPREQESSFAKAVSTELGIEDCDGCTSAPGGTP